MAKTGRGPDCLEERVVGDFQSVRKTFVLRQHSLLKAFAVWFLGIAVFVALSLSSLRAQSVTVAWNVGPGSVTGNKLYYGLASRSYTSIIDVGKATSTSISGLVAGKTYYFAVTSYNAMGLESSFSSEIVYTIPLTNGAVPVQGLVCNWKLDEGSGTSAADASGSGNNGTLVNSPTWTTGKINGALSFNGVNNYVVTPAVNLSGSRSASVSLWVNRAYNKTGGHALFESSPNINASTTGFMLFPDDTSVCSGGGMLVGLRGNAGENLKCYAQPTSGVWHHLVVVFDKSQNALNEVNLYLDGVLQTAQAQPSSSDNTNSFGTNPLYLMCRGGIGDFCSGIIDDFRLYNRSLSPAEVQQLYALGSTSTPPAISLTTPANGTTVSGTITISATATDNLGIAGVQFKVDALNLGSELTAPPFQTLWNSVSAANGTHTITATARDPAGNTASAVATFTVSNTAPVQGLVCNWKLDEGSGTSASDASGS